EFKAYAVSAKRRLAAAPDIPTVAEAGFPGLDATVWFGFFVPAGTRHDIIAKLNAATVEALPEQSWGRGSLAVFGGKIRSNAFSRRLNYGWLFILQRAHSCPARREPVAV